MKLSQSCYNSACSALPWVPCPVSPCRIKKMGKRRTTNRPRWGRRGAGPHSSPHRPAPRAAPPRPPATRAAQAARAPATRTPQLCLTEMVRTLLKLCRVLVGAGPGVLASTAGMCYVKVAYVSQLLISLPWSHTSVCSAFCFAMVMIFPSALNL